MNFRKFKEIDIFYDLSVLINVINAVGQISAGSLCKDIKRASEFNKINIHRRCVNNIELLANFRVRPLGKMAVSFYSMRCFGEALTTMKRRERPCIVQRRV